ASIRRATSTTSSDVARARYVASGSNGVAALATGALAASNSASVGIAPEGGLQVNTIRVARAIAVLFPEVTTIGGYRQDALKWHPSGLAIDVMIPNHSSPDGIALGNQIAGYALANAKRWGVIHVIWRQGFYPAEEAPSWTADYGNETANHFDHVHIATNGGGYPTGNEHYFI
ncbi:glycoside hydrolase, partial [Mycobacterium sp. E740]|uniref:glycoside hydrolase n=1 Tax=Mycobacterium sp. E740 TaxID=1834149 RepID=UPI001E5356FA